MNDKSLYLSDLFIHNFKYFLLGVSLGSSLVPSAAFADEIPKVAPPIEAPPSASANFTKVLILGAACDATVNCGRDLGQKAAEKVTKKAVEIGPLGGIGVIGCIFVTGWYFGRLIDRAVERVL